MRWAFLLVIVLHGLIHLMGFAKGFGYAELPQLTQPISRATGSLWLFGALAMGATALVVVAAPHWWWAVGVFSVAVSQAVILTSWRDAKFGTLANAVILLGVAYGFASRGPVSFHAEYEREVRRRLARATPGGVVTEADLAPLPEPVRRYVRLSGALGQPRVRNLRATWRGRIRESAAASWMEFSAEQHNFFDEPARLFLMDARTSGVPVDVLHAFVGSSATMRVRLLSLLPLVDARGPDMNRAETVTLFNDLCLFAPAALVDPGIGWEAIGLHAARATYAKDGITVGALLSFNDAGELTDFVSEDRLRASPDGKVFTRVRWSTPVGSYRWFGPRRVCTTGEARWHLPEGSFAYIELELVDIQYNVAEVWMRARGIGFGGGSAACVRYNGPPSGPEIGDGR